MPGVSNFTLASPGSGVPEAASRTPEFQKPLPCSVGLIDTGVDTGHPDLRGSDIDVGPRFDSTIATEATEATEATDGHGTGMAGLIVGEGGGEDRVLGIAPDATLLSVQGSGTGRPAARRPC